MININKAKLLQIISATYLDNCGDKYEREYGKYITSAFSNYGKFWQQFIVPMTRRIETQSKIQDPYIESSGVYEGHSGYSGVSAISGVTIEQRLPDFSMEATRSYGMEHNEAGSSSSGIMYSEIDRENEDILSRENVSEDLQDIAAIHYTVFLNLIYAYTHLKEKSIAYFEDFYTHLVSACDLAEDFFIEAYMLTEECSGQVFSQKNNIGKIILKYKESKTNGNKYLYRNEKIKIIKRYLDNKITQKTKEFLMNIRKYRNAIIHNCKIGMFFDGTQHIVPKKEKINDYRSWHAITAVKNSHEILRNDFVEMNHQMKSDFNGLVRIFDQLWENPIANFQKLFYEDNNVKLLEKYDINPDQW